MDGIIKVDPQVLQAKASEFDTIRAEMMSTIDAMTGKVRSLTGTWEGEAATDYQSKYSQLSDDIEYMNSIITEHVSDLNEMAERYTAAAGEVAGGTESLPVDIIK